MKKFAALVVSILFVCSRFNAMAIYNKMKQRNDVIGFRFSCEDIHIVVIFAHS